MWQLLETHKKLLNFYNNQKKSKYGRNMFYCCASKDTQVTSEDLKMCPIIQDITVNKTLKRDVTSHLTCEKSLYPNLAIFKCQRE